MEKFEIVVLPEVLNFIDKLPLILIQEGYLSTYENALRFAEDIISFMEQIPQSDSFFRILSNRACVSVYCERALCRRREEG